ncbi:glycosyl transferase [Perkinsus olseni]|nr:glycosyl transferase [Perkinsus olseni]
MIASKMQNSFSPEIESLMRICDGAYDVSQVEQMEHTIIRALDYRIDLPTAWTYLRRWNQVFGLRKPYYFISAYFLELTLLEYEALKYRPAVLALACAWVALCMKKDRKKQQATMTLLQDGVLDELGISAKELTSAAHFITTIVRHHRPDANNLNAVTRKYQSEERLCVAKRIEEGS